MTSLRIKILGISAILLITGIAAFGVFMARVNDTRKKTATAIETSKAEQ